MYVFVITVTVTVHIETFITRNFVWFARCVSDDLDKAGKLHKLRENGRERRPVDIRHIKVICQDDIVLKRERI